MSKKQEKLDFERCVTIKKSGKYWVAECKLGHVYIQCLSKSYAKRKAMIDFKSPYKFGVYTKFLQKLEGDL